MVNDTLPTVFHLTHWKAGSQWVAEVLRNIAPDRIISPSATMDQVLLRPLIPGSVYPTVYLPHSEFKKVLKPDVDLEPERHTPSSADPLEVQNWYNFTVLRRPVRKFVVIRDLRDTLVSLYFSVKISHPVINEHIAAGRQALSNLDFEEGLLHILNTRVRKNALIQRSWLKPCDRGEALLIRYEDLIADEQTGFAKIIEYCQIDILPAKLEDIVNKSSFSKQAGRKPGEEDVSSHYRKGISGDWKNHFTDRIKAEFKEKFGQILIDTGYERDLNW